MDKNKKITILIILIIVMTIVWMPKDKRKKQSAPAPTRISTEKVLPKITFVERKRTEFVEWGGSPFVWSRAGTSTVADWTLSGIIWDNEASYAIIDGTIVHPGDKIADKTIKRIERSKVILTDGLKDYTLELQ